MSLGYFSCRDLGGDPAHNLNCTHIAPKGAHHNFDKFSDYDIRQESLINPMDTVWCRGLGGAEDFGQFHTAGSYEQDACAEGVFTLETTRLTISTRRR